MTTEVNTAKLSTEQANQLHSLVEAANFFQLSTTIAAPNQPDRFQYQVTVQEGDRSRTITVDESAVPNTLRPLLECLMNYARQR